jgi:lysophospholipase L1-like esterase
MACNRYIGLLRSLMTAAVCCLVALFVAETVINAEANRGVYVALGDSIDFGLDGDVGAVGVGYVGPFGVFLASILGPMDVYNLSAPFATSRDVLHTQVPAAVALLQGRAPAVVSWGGGGNDILEVVRGPQAAVCPRTPSCLGRLNGLLNGVETTIDHTIARLRGAVGPNGRILMRTQYNSLAKTGCAPADVVLLGNITFEGAPGTVLDRGLNDRIRTVAARYNAKVVDLFGPFFFNANQFVGADCVHPSALGYQAIQALFAGAFLTP